MYIIYFPYIFMLTILMAVVCHKQEKSLWWPVAICFAPILTPYFLIKSGKNQPGKWISLFVISFVLVVGAEGFLWFKAYKKDQFSRMNPVERTTFRLTQAIQTNMAEMNEVMQSLDIKNTVASGKKEILIAKDLIARANILIRQSQKITRQFTFFVTDYGPYFQQTHQDWALQLRNFYKSVHMVKYYSTTQQYLNEFERLLNYTQTHFDQIRSRKSKEMKSYDQYFIRYRHGLNIYQKYSDERMKAQKALVDNYPESKPYLPAKAQTRAVNLWE